MSDAYERTDVRVAHYLCPETWLSEPLRSVKCVTAFFDDYAAPLLLFLGLKLINWFSTMLASVENWKPAKKGKINQVRERSEQSRGSLCAVGL